MPIAIALILATLTGVAGFALGLIYHDEITTLLEDALENKRDRD